MNTRFLVLLPDAQRPDVTHLNVVVNWFEELKRRVCLMGWRRLEGVASERSYFKGVPGCVGRFFRRLLGSVAV